MAHSKLSLPHFHIETVDSTNEEAKRLAKQEKNLALLDKGVIVTANTQTAGKGRHGHSWVSDSTDGLYYSLCFKPFSFSFDKVTDYHLSIGSDVATIIKTITQIHIELEWPNDLLIGHKKVAGILLETSLTNGELLPDYLIVGVGINLNQSFFIPSICAQATSLYLTSGKRYPKKPFVDALSDRIPKLFQNATQAN